MPDNSQFDFFKDFTLEQQNSFLHKYLIETTKYLVPTKFEHSPGFFFYEASFINEKYNDNSISNLAYLLMLLVNRDYIWPIKFNNGNPTHPSTGTYIPYYVFVKDINQLNDPDFGSFEYMDLNEASKVISN